MNNITLSPDLNNKFIDYMTLYIPRSLNKRISRKDLENSLDYIKSSSENSEHTEAIVDSFLDNIDIYDNTRCSIESYIDAVIYNTYLFRGYNHSQAYKRTFKQKIKDLSLEYKDLPTLEKAISSAASYYHNKDIVNKIKEKITKPAWLLHTELFDLAAETAKDIMLNGKSEMAKVQMTNSILSNFKKPETQKVDIDIKDDRKAETILNTLEQLARSQKEAADKGLPLMEVNFDILEESKDE